MIVKGIQDASYLGKELREIECWKKKHSIQNGEIKKMHRHFPEEDIE